MKHFLYILIFGLSWFHAIDVRAEDVANARHVAELNDSNFDHPAISKQPRVLEYLLDSVGPKGKYVSIKMTNGEDCHFDSTQSDWTLSETDPCLLALQVYYSATKAALYFKSIGYQLPEPVTISLQDDSLIGEVASADDRSIRFRTIKKEQLPSWQQPIIDVVFHEMTHVAQSLNGQKEKMIGGKLSSTFIEGYANLFAYLLCGRTDLGVRDGAPGMQVLTQKQFGRVPAGRYDAAEPFTSVMSELTKEIKKTAGPLSGEELSKQVGSLYLKAFFQMKETSNYQDLFKEVRNGLSALPVAVDSQHLIQFLEARLDQRGLNMDASQFDGQTSGFLIEGYSIDFLRTYMNEIIKNPSSKTEIHAQEGMKRDEKIIWPMKGYIFSQVDLQNLSSCIGEKFNQLPQEQQQHPNAVNFATIACFEDFAKLPLAVPGLVVTQRVMEFDQAGSSFSVDPTRTIEACQSQIAVAYSWVFDQSGNKIGELGIPLKCR